MLEATSTKKWWEGLKPTPKARCQVCNSGQGYTNPMAKCFECKRKFCFDHILCGQVNSSMKENDEVRDICEEC